MTLKRTIRQTVEQLAGVRIFNVLPHGVDVAHDIALALPAYRVDTIFDVGANVGQSAAYYLERFPAAQIYCFEPVSDTFLELQASVDGHKRVHCSRLAFGSAVGTGQMAVGSMSDLSFLVRSDAAPSGDRPTEEVEVSTIDRFCAAQNIARVGYLKIDTEGGDLEVLQGAPHMLHTQSIDFIQVEASMHAGNRTHVPFESLKQYVEKSGYVLFGIYSQVRERSNRLQLRRTNATFISRRMIETYGRPV